MTINSLPLCSGKNSKNLSFLSALSSIMTRSEYLNEMIRDFKTIAITGTSGKSTIGLFVFLMDKLCLMPNLSAVKLIIFGARDETLSDFTKEIAKSLTLLENENHN